MATIYKYYKNSNTGHVMKSQEFRGIPIKGIPVYFYSFGRAIGKNLPLNGYVEISRKKYDRYKRKPK